MASYFYKDGYGPDLSRKGKVAGQIGPAPMEGAPRFRRIY